MMHLVMMVETGGGLDGIKILSDENTGVVFCLGLGYFFSALTKKIFRPVLEKSYKSLAGKTIVRPKSQGRTEIRPS